MTTIQTRRYEMLLRVRNFGEAHRDVFPTSTPGGQGFALVDQAVTGLAGHALSKMSTARETNSARGRARDAILTQLDAINRAAKVIAQDAPGFDDPFRLSRKRKSDQALLTVGRLFVQHAETRKIEFVALGMPNAFVEDLSSAVDRLEGAIRSCEAGRGAQAAARAGIGAALAAGLAATRKLDVIVGIQFASDPMTLAVWARDRRVDNPRRRRTASAAASPAPEATPTITRLAS